MCKSVASICFCTSSSSLYMVKGLQQLAARDGLLQHHLKSEEVKATLSALFEMREPPFEGEWALTRERVQIAILMSAQSNLEYLLKGVAGAQIDWRDTLMGAGIGESNWRSVAIKAGYDVA